jgi:hypothetical protein
MLRAAHYSPGRARFDALPTRARVDAFDRDQLNIAVLVLCMGVNLLAWLRALALMV